MKIEIAKNGPRAIKYIENQMNTRCNPKSYYYEEKTTLFNLSFRFNTPDCRGRADT